MSKKIKYFLAIASISLLIFPKFVFAFISPWDYVNTALEGIEEKAGKVAKYLVSTFGLYVLGILLVILSSHLLQFVITHPEWLTLKNSVWVKAGFNFTAGIANMLLILIFLVIAFALILKIETFAAKKALPRLLIVALLINFILLFIGMLIDIATIVYNTILEGNENLVEAVLNQLLAGMHGMLMGFLGSFAAFAMMALIPLVHALPLQVALLVGLSVFILPFVVIWFGQLVSAYLMAGILFTYLFLFVARIFVVQILAVLSPIAFLCLILPQTEKYWQEWLRHLLQWVFLGVFLLFFLVLGFRAFDALIQDEYPTITIFAWGTIGEYFYYYLFLFIFLVVALFISKRFTPTLAKTLIEQAQIWGRRSWKKVGEPIARTYLSVLRKALAEGLKDWAKRREEKPPPTPEPGIRGMPTRLKEAVAGTLAGWALKVAVEDKMKEVEKKKEEYKKEFKLPERLIGEIRKAILPENRIAALLAAIEKKWTRQIEKAKLRGAVIEIGREALKIHPELFKPIRDAFPTLAPKMGRGLPEERIRAGEISKREAKEKGYKYVIERLIAEMKPAKFETMSKAEVLSNIVIDTLQRKGNAEQVATAARTFGRDFVEKFTRLAEEMGRSLEWFRKNNPKLARYLERAGAIQLGLIIKKEAELIRPKAYEIYQRRIREKRPGDEKSDWLEAERELKREWERKREEIGKKWEETERVPPEIRPVEKKIERPERAERPER